MPALIYLAGFRQHIATGTSLAVLLPPVGVGAVIEYYRHGNVDIPAAMVLAIALTIGGYFGAVAANRLSGPDLLMGIWLVRAASGVLSDGWRIQASGVVVNPD